MDRSSNNEIQVADFSNEKNSLLDVNDLEDNERDYKSLLIVNESSDAKLTLYIYHKLAVLCKFSTKSKIIERNQKYLHRETDTFKFELVAKFEDERKPKTLLQPMKWMQEKVFRVTESLQLIKEDPTKFLEVKRVCLRKIYRVKELSDEGGKMNLYEILGLDMEEVRKMKNDEASKAIKKAFHKKIRIWHPDKNFGDGEIAMQIIVAKEILLDGERRARYHNAVDYDKGWLSLKRFKAIFWPECFNDEQNYAFWRRITMFAVSLGLTVGGITLSASTAGAAVPAAVVVGAMFGVGFTGAGFSSMMHTINRKSVADKCELKSWFIKLGAGFVSGAVTGGAAAGIAAGIVGVGSAAAQSSAVTAGEYVAIGAGSGAVGGFSSSVTSDAARSLTGEEKVTIKQAVGRAIAGTLVGASCGALGGAATQGIVSREASAAAVNLERQTAEQALLQTGGRRLGDALVQGVSRQLAEAGTGAILGTATQFVEERLDDSVENQHPKKHVVRALENVAASSVKASAVEGVGTLVSQGISEFKLKMGTENVEHTDVNCLERRYELNKGNNEEKVDWQSIQGSGTYKPVETDEKSKELHQKSDGNNKKVKEVELEDLKEYGLPKEYAPFDEVIKKGLEAHRVLETPLQPCSQLCGKVQEPVGEKKDEQRKVDEFNDRKSIEDSEDGKPNGELANEMKMTEMEKLKDLGESSGTIYKVKDESSKENYAPLRYEENEQGVDNLCKETIERVEHGESSKKGNNSTSQAVTGVRKNQKQLNKTNTLNEVDAPSVIFSKRSKVSISGEHEVDESYVVIDEKNAGERGDVTVRYMSKRKGNAEMSVTDSVDSGEKTYEVSKDASNAKEIETEDPKEGSFSEADTQLDEEIAGEAEDGTIRYLSKGTRVSKMIVTYSFDGDKKTVEVSGNGKRIHVPSSAAEIEVKFQVRRPHWIDIMKYDRFRKVWCEPSEPHIFRYKKPPIRTFTITGNIGWDAVTRVSDEYHEETDEIQGLF